MSFARFVDNEFFETQLKPGGQPAKKDPATLRKTLKSRVVCIEKAMAKNLTNWVTDGLSKGDCRQRPKWLATIHFNFAIFHGKLL